MNIQSFVLFLVALVILFYLSFRFLNGNSKRVVISILSLILVLFICFIGIYAFNRTVRLVVDARVNQTSVHKVLNHGQSISLPANTTFLYRSAETSATYFTLTSKIEIIRFFKAISEHQKFSESMDQDKITFLNNGTQYTVTIFPNVKPSGNLITIDSNDVNNN